MCGAMTTSGTDNHYCPYIADPENMTSRQLLRPQYTAVVGLSVVHCVTPYKRVQRGVLLTGDVQRSVPSSSAKVVLVSADGTIRLLRMCDRSGDAISEEHRGQITHLQFTPNGSEGPIAYNGVCAVI